MPSDVRFLAVFMTSLRITPNAMMLAMQEVHSVMLEQTAQNLAHANTVGFKAFRIKLKEAFLQSKSSTVSSIAIDSVQRSCSSGPTTLTHDPYNLAITGSGFFGFQTEGGVRYGRNGQLHLSDDGFVVDLQGNFLLNSDQTPIQIPRHSTWYVSSRGNININGKPNGSVGVFYFDDPQTLKPVGHNLSEATTQEPRQSEDFTLTQGAVEESNVSIMREAIQLINIQRNFEHSQKLMEEYDQQQRKINQINARNA